MIFYAKKLSEQIKIPTIDLLLPSVKTFYLFTFFFNKNKDAVDNERQSRKFESVYSKKVRAGKRRTYFFDVRRTKGEDFYLTLTESSRRMDGGYERHKIFLYKEDFNRFIESLEETINHIKTELMPQYDYDEFARRQDEYEARMREENSDLDPEDGEHKPIGFKKDVAVSADAKEDEKEEPKPIVFKKNVIEDDDMSW